MHLYISSSKHIPSNILTLHNQLLFTWKQYKNNKEQINIISSKNNGIDSGIWKFNLSENIRKQFIKLILQILQKFSTSENQGSKTTPKIQMVKISLILKQNSTKI